MTTEVSQADFKSLRLSRLQRRMHKILRKSLELKQRKENLAAGKQELTAKISRAELIAGLRNGLSYEVQKHLKLRQMRMAELARNKNQRPERQLPPREREKQQERTRTHRRQREREYTR